MLLQQCCIYIKQRQTYIRKRTCCSACVTQACDLGQSFVEHIDYKTLLSPDQSAVFNHPWIGYCQKKSRYHLKMIQLVVKVVVVCCFCAQILEGSPLTGGEHGENQIITPEQLRSLQVIIIIIILIMRTMLMIDIIIIIL